MARKQDFKSGLRQYFEDPNFQMSDDLKRFLDQDPAMRKAVEEIREQMAKIQQAEANLQDTINLFFHNWF